MESLENVGHVPDLHFCQAVLKLAKTRMEPLKERYQESF